MKEGEIEGWESREKDGIREEIRVGRGKVNKEGTEKLMKATQ